MNEQFSINESDIAIIGMFCRVPGANDYDAFWRNLRDGVESISFFSEEEVLAAGVEPELVSHPNYVKAGGILSDIDQFDASFFGYTPREAAMMDPQHRLFLQGAWKALEDAGYDPNTFEGSIGVYAGVGMSTYLLNNLAPDRKLLQSVSGYQVMIGNDKDFLATRVSYKLNLKGPSINVQSACSTSLVAIHLACQSLLSGESDMALAGGATIVVPQKEGYLYQEGMILSPDGHCRAFDARAQGTVPGSGVGIVVLKWLKDALADGDHVHAVIKGSAINNDGSLKVGYTAPSVDGQAKVISEAQAVAGVSADTISYIEAHGTGTPLGDPIEIAALTKAFQRSRDKEHKGDTTRCAIGSVKSNVGHLDTAAGVAGVIKSVLALKHKMLPPSLHFESPNPKIALADSPFYINNKLSEWKTNGTPRRAGVSSFGIGGTNAHIILEEAPPQPASDDGRAWQLLLLSAKSASALDQASANLAQHLQTALHSIGCRAETGALSANPKSIRTLSAIGCRAETGALSANPKSEIRNPKSEILLADVAYTLSIGRQAFDERRIAVCQDAQDAAKALATLDPKQISTRQGEGRQSRPEVVFMFSGQGAQYVNMGRELYEQEPTFAQEVDRCAELLKPHLGLDLRDLLYPNPEESEKAAQQLKQTKFTQPALFVIEYALAQLWLSWGVRPDAMIGHSIGEYVAACLAGVFSLEQALSLVAARGQLMQRVPVGSMLAVPLPEKEVRRLLVPELVALRQAQEPGGENRQVEVAVINAPSLCVVSGPTDAVKAFEKQLTEQGVAGRLLHTSHAFHSHMMAPILHTFSQLVKQHTSANHTPTLDIPYISNVTGTWISAQQAADPSYWAKHMRQTVRFADGMTELLADPNRILLEVGPGQTLATLARRQRHPDKPQLVLSSLRRQAPARLKEAAKKSDVAFLLNSLGQLWLAGVDIDWPAFYAHQPRQRVPLPTYPFQGQPCWIEPPQSQAYISAQEGPLLRSKESKNPNVAEWFYIPSWKRAPITAGDQSLLSCTLLFANLQSHAAEGALGEQLAKRLELAGHDVITIKVGSRFKKLNRNLYALNPGQPDHYDALLNELHALNKKPQTIVHLFSVTENEPVAQPHASQESTPKHQKVEKAQDLGFNSLLFLAQAIGKNHITAPLQIAVVSNNLQKVTGKELLRPEKATVLGLCKVIPQEYPNLVCRSIDIVLPDSGSHDEKKVIEQLLTELSGEASDPVVAYRGDDRWVQSFQSISLGNSANTTLLPTVGGGISGGGSSLSQAAKAPKARLKKGGVYLITGGLGDIGLLLAEYLAKTAQAKLVLTGRSPFPPRHEWETWRKSDHEDQEEDKEEEDEVSYKIRRVQAIEALGGEVLVTSADVGDEREMQLVVALAEARFGPLNGVIHGAAVLGKQAIRPIRETTQSECEQQFHPKVHGLLVLDKVLQGKKLDFALLHSSLSSVLGGVGFSAYSAANLFMDAVATASMEKPAASVPWISINWDGWQFEKEETANGALGAKLQQLAITPKEGIEVFERILSLHQGHQVVVSTANLQARLDKWVKLKPLTPPPPSQPTNGAKNQPKPIGDQASSPKATAHTHDEEQMLTELWQKLLGIKRIGRHDNFFELGGHSLLAIQLFAEIERTIGPKLPLATLFEAPTIAELSKLLEELTPKNSDVIMIQRGNPKTHLPFFCASGGGGNVLNYAHLARHLGPEQPFYGLQAPGVDKTRPPYRRVEQIAAHHIKEIRSIQPTGPYFLGGMCFGATVAFEMGQQLHKQGERADVFVIDAMRPDTEPALRAYIRLFTYHSRYRQFNYIYEIIKQRLNEKLMRASEHPFQHLIEPHLDALKNYTYQPYPGKITLFKNEFNTLRGDETYMYDTWFKIPNAQLETHVVRGSHGTILNEPYVQDLAKTLRTCLDNAQP